VEWSPEQERALRAVDAWLKDPHRPQVFRLYGYAGTGKTTLAKYLAQDVDGDVCFAAYTGKAAHVLRQKGCIGATTIHSLIYRPAGKKESQTELLMNERQQLEEKLSLLGQEEKPDNSFARAMTEHARLRSEIRKITELIDEEEKEARRPCFKLNVDSKVRDAALIVVDECSMVDDQIGRDLEWFGKPILVLADPAQLPPVRGGGYFTLNEPDILLTEVHRQARESGILRLATIVRSGGAMPLMESGDCIVRNKGDWTTEIALTCDQILVGKNVTRHVSNRRSRQLRGIETPFPVSGDKVVCLRNDHEHGLLNGSLWRVHEIANDEKTLTATVTMSSEEDGPQGVEVETWLHHFLGREEELKKLSWNRRDCQEFDFGDALTVHKAQGSQWNDVMLIDESWVFKSDARRWLYTGITRAATRLHVVRL
jgi:exodeoxyribonuclease V